MGLTPLRRQARWRRRGSAAFPNRVIRTPSPFSSQRIPKFKPSRSRRSRDLLQRLLTEILDLQDLALGLTNEIAE